MPGQTGLPQIKTHYQLYICEYLRLIPPSLQKNEAIQSHNENVIILALELLSIMRSHQSSIQPTDSVLLSNSNVLISFAVKMTQSYSDKEFRSEFGDSGRGKYAR
jgi:hypothetical protein